MKNKTTQALVLNFSLCWLLALLAYLAGLKFVGLTAVIVGMIYMLIPALSVFVLSKFVWKTPLKNWGIKKPQNKIILWAIIFPYILAVSSLGVSLLFPGIKFEPQMQGMVDKLGANLPPEALIAMKDQISSLGGLLPLIILGQSILAGLTINALAAFGEEYFWRGFLLKQLAKYGWIRSSLIIGFIWGLWHAPLILQGHNYPQHPIVGVPMMIIWCTLLSFSLTYFVTKTKSVFTAAWFHGILNASAGFGLLWISNSSDLIAGVTGLAGFIALFVLNLILFFIDKKSSHPVDSLLNEY
ncbi:MAG: CPBP family intramembrane metalloprotease [Candidatus Shapirobacteria bacterium]|nr:CPBP family intramembrane metalloprotease [Candidatus Shapirobacteria bacterium]